MILYEHDIYFSVTIIEEEKSSPGKESMIAFFWSQG